ncbi:MAG: hypothetical protein QM726_10915 [Chitinophagaceae bacterium]
MVIDYALQGDYKMEAPPEEKDIVFDFKKDKTFTTTMGKGKKTDTGTGLWKYDAAKKVINLIMHGKVGSIITAITDSELTMTTDLKPNGTGQTLKIVYKIKTS